MNPSTLIGMLASLLLLAVLLVFSAQQPGLFVDLPALGIVVVGTFAATFISYPLREVLRIFSLIKTVVRHEREYTQEDIDELVSLSRLWIDGDLRAVEDVLDGVKNPFLRSGVQLVIDKTPLDDILDLLQWRIARLRAKEHAEAQLFRVMASYAPAFGMLGTLVGLVNLMFVLGDGDMVTIGQQVAVGERNAFEALCLAASLGGDTDTIAAILGAMLGACLGLQCWPDAMIEQVKAVNGLELQPLVQGLLKLR